MSNPDVLTTFADPDPNATPVTLGDLVTILKTLVSSAIQGSYIPYVLGADTPSVDDQDKAWIQLSSSPNGRPLAIKTFYNGNWRRVYNGMLGEIRMYNGNPADPTNGFDSSGLGLVGGDLDGWHLCNGVDGTPNFTDYYPVGAHMDNSNGQVGYNSGWQTFVNGTTVLQKGGSATFTLTEGTTYRPPYPNPRVPLLQNMDHYTIPGGGEASDPTGHLWGLDSTQHLEVVPQDLGNTTPNPIQVLSPFQATALIIFVGYA